MHGTVVITGGGTGGHLNVAREFIQAFSKRGITPIFIGSSNGKDQEWFAHEPKLKSAIFLDTRGVVNKDFQGKVTSLLNIVKETNRCLNIFDKNDVKTVISVGGYSAAPATFAAILKTGCKLYIHEQNSVMGKLNEVTARFAKEVFSSYENSSRVKDYPVKIDFFNEARIRKDVKKIIFLGGSHGAKAINDFALSVAKKLTSDGIEIIHQTGKEDYVKVVKEYVKLEINAEVFAFSDDLDKKMGEADFAVSRAGASTLWELSANALPTLFVPYPYAAKDHQYYNATFLRDKGMAFVARENELSSKTLFTCLHSDLHKMSKALTNSIMFDSIESMLNIVISDNNK